MSLPVTGKLNVGGVQHRLVRNRRQIVAIEVDIQNADRNLAVLQGFDLLRQPLRQGHAAAADADERQLIQVFGALQNFVRQPDQRAVDFRGAHQLFLLDGDRHVGKRFRLTQSVSNRGHISKRLHAAANALG